MLARRVVPVLAVVLSLGCAGGADAPADGDGSRPSPSPTEPLPADRQSSVCTAYAAQLAAAEAALAKHPGDPALREKVGTYRAIIADACN